MGVEPLTKQPQSYSMPLLPVAKKGSQTLTDKHRAIPLPIEVRGSPDGHQNSNGPNKNYPRSHFISCDNCCSCASKNQPDRSDCCHLCKTNYIPFIFKLILIGMAAVLIIEFLYKTFESFIDRAIEKLNGMDLTTTTKIGKL